MVDYISRRYKQAEQVQQAQAHQAQVQLNNKTSNMESGCMILRSLHHNLIRLNSKPDSRTQMEREMLRKHEYQDSLYRFLLTPEFPLVWKWSLRTSAAILRYR